MNNQEPQEKMIHQTEYFSFDGDTVEKVIEKLINIHLTFQQKYPTFTRLVVDNNNCSDPRLIGYRLETPEEVTERLNREEESEKAILKQKRLEYEKLKQLFEKEPN